MLEELGENRILCLVWKRILNHGIFWNCQRVRLSFLAIWWDEGKGGKSFSCLSDNLQIERLTRLPDSEWHTHAGLSLCHSVSHYVTLVSESFMHCHLHHTLVSQVTKGLMLVKKETSRQDFYMLTCLVHIIQVSSHTGKVTCLTRNCLLLKLLARTQDRATPRVCLRVTQRHIGLGVFHTLSHRVTLLNTV